MNQDDIIVMAREADGEEQHHGMWRMHLEDLERFANLVAAAEREACARVCDEVDRRWINQAEKCAERIRARGE